MQITNYRPVILRKVDETDEFKVYNPYLPKFMRPTATVLLRDNEIQRIPDNLTRNNKIDEVLHKHREYLSDERVLFVSTKFQYLKEKKLKERKQELNKSRNELGSRTAGNESRDNDNSNMDAIPSTRNSKKEEKFNLMMLMKEVSKTLNDYNVENEFKSIIKKNFIDTDHNIELELKKYHDESEVVEFFFDKISWCSEDNLNKIFTIFLERQKEFVNIISKTLLEIVSFIKHITKFLDILIKNSLPLDSFLQNTIAICAGVLDKERLKCEIIFINHGLDIILDILKSKPYYRTIMCQLIFALITNNKYSHYQVLSHIRNKFINCDELLFYHIIVKCMENTTEENMDEKTVEFYDTAYRKGINSNCDIIKCKSIHLINIFMKFDPLISLSYHNQIFKHKKSWNWEILSLIIIYCAKILSVYNTLKEEKEKLNENQELIEKDENLRNNLNDLEEKLKEIETYEGLFLSTIDEIFQEKNPNMTIKVGMYYTSNI